MFANKIVCEKQTDFINYYYLNYFRVGEDGPWDQVSHIFTSTNSTLYQVTGLLPFTVYSFRAIAVNSLGLSFPSKESYYIVTLREGKHYLTPFYLIIHLLYK